MRRILVAVDDSDASDRVVEFVNGFFGGMDVEVTGMNVGRLPHHDIPAGVGWGGMYAWAWPVSPYDGRPESGLDEAPESVATDEALARRVAEETVRSSGLNDR